MEYAWEDGGGEEMVDSCAWRQVVKFRIEGIVEIDRALGRMYHAIRNALCDSR
jgi:hypothetical protein